MNPTPIQSSDPLDAVLDIVRITETGKHEELDWYSWDVRVSHRVPRHGGKLIANCPTEKLAHLVRDSIGTLILQDGLSWDVEFEVIRKPTPILVTDSNFDQVFPSGWSTPNDERNPE